MSKNSLYLIVAFALAATAASFFITRNSSQSCVTIQAVETASSPTEETLHAKVHGYPMSYYQEPMPLNCMSGFASPSTSTFNTTHLAYDFLIWLGVALLLFFPPILYRWWSGPKMLGDNVRRS
jgi:hypothetical protein